MIGTRDHLCARGQGTARSGSHRNRKLQCNKRRFVSNFTRCRSWGGDFATTDKPVDRLRVLECAWLDRSPGHTSSCSSLVSRGRRSDSTHLYHFPKLNPPTTATCACVGTRHQKDPLCVGSLISDACAFLQYEPALGSAALHAPFGLHRITDGLACCTTRLIHP